MRPSKSESDTEPGSEPGGESAVTFEVVEGELSGDKKIRRRGVYLLPNLFTTAALFSGYYAILASMSGFYEKAAIAIFLAMILDGLDGRVARLTNTQSAFGAQYDSLSDLIAFGVAPSVLIYSWGLDSLGKAGWMASFIFAACTALRLARFNVEEESSDKRFFTGLASPSAAAIVTAFVWFSHDMSLTSAGMAGVGLLLTVVIGSLMVSNVKYYSFKKIDFKGRVPFAAIVLLLMVFSIIFIDPPKVLFAVFLIYALSGPVWAAKRWFKINRNKADSSTIS